LVESYYDNKDELGIRWNDPVMKLDWPTKDPILSERDQKNPLFADLAPEHLAYFRG
jgi:dTDP-4-dehydrorhamnose 3,5-epimerase